MTLAQATTNLATAESNLAKFNNVSRQKTGEVEMDFRKFDELTAAVRYWTNEVARLSAPSRARVMRPGIRG
jgi:hypothetical protein